MRPANSRHHRRQAGPLLATIAPAPAPARRFEGKVLMFTRPASRLLAALVIGLISPLTARAAEPAVKPLPKAMPPQAPLKSVQAFPQPVMLDGPRDHQQLIVVGGYADGRQWDLTRQAIFTS